MESCMPMRTYIRHIRSSASNAYLHKRGVETGEATRLHGLPRIYRAPGSKIILGDGVVLAGRNAKNSLEANYPCTLRTLTSGARIEVSDDVGITSSTIAAVHKITIGARTMIGTGTIITDSDHHYIGGDPSCRRYAGIPPGTDADLVSIGDDVFIGARSIILRGVTVGNGATIGAGSVVTRDIPAGAVAAGNPCRQVSA